jgi:hypothetical protein
MVLKHHISHNQRLVEDVRVAVKTVIETTDPIECCRLLIRHCNDQHPLVRLAVIRYICMAVLIVVSLTQLNDAFFYLFSFVMQFKPVVEQYFGLVASIHFSLKQLPVFIFPHFFF